MRYEPVTPDEYRAHRGSERPGTRALSAAVDIALPGGPAKPAQRVNDRPVRGGTARSIHSVGRATDNFPRNNVAGWTIALRMIAHHRDLQVCEVIYERRRWTPETGMRRYTGENPHLDHIHAAQTRAGAGITAPFAALVRIYHAVLTRP